MIFVSFIRAIRRITFLSSLFNPPYSIFFAVFIIQVPNIIFIYFTAFLAPFISFCYLFYFHHFVLKVFFPLSKLFLLLFHSFFFFDWVIVKIWPGHNCIICLSSSCVLKPLVRIVQYMINYVWFIKWRYF